jgi:predicted nucleotidyltransferase component of viral defense system
MKGGNALILLYNEPRLSEDIDFDMPNDAANRQKFLSAIDRMCAQKNWEYRIGKNTDTVTRIFLRENATDNRPLKIEISHRKRQCAKNIVSINGISTYNIDTLARQKCNAYSSRDRIRDLQDLSFIMTRYSKQLTDITLDQIDEAFTRKVPLDQFDYLRASNQEELTEEEWDSLEKNVLRLSEILVETDIQPEPTRTPITTEPWADIPQDSFEPRF